jgi:uncharacterized protein (DUF3084 family)
VLWVILLASVAVLGGLIAYAGDVTGRKIGRKHLRLFGLRPRATAMVIAILSGVAVALLSVGVVGLLARDALNTALQAQEVRADRDQVRRELKELSKQQELLVEQRAGLEKSLASAETSLAVARNDLERVRSELDKTTLLNGNLSEQKDAVEKERNALVEERERLIADRTRLEGERTRLEGQRTRLEGERAALVKQRDTLTGQINGQKAELQRVNRLAEESARANAGLNASLAVLRGQRSKLETELRDLRLGRDALNTLKLKLEDRVAGLNKQVTDLNGRVTNLTSRYNSLQAQIKPVQDELNQLKAERKAVEADRAALKNDVASLQYQKNSLDTDTAALKKQIGDLGARLAQSTKQLATAQRARNQAELELSRAKAELDLERKANGASSYVFRRGELIHEVVVPEDDIASARSRLQAAARTAAEVAADRGAGRAGVSLVSPSDIERAAATTATSPGPDLVMLRSDRNLARGLPLGVDFESMPNKVIFRSGQPARSRDITVLNGSRQRGVEDLRFEVTALIADLKRDLKARGVPSENIPASLVPEEEVEEFVQRLRSTDRLEPGALAPSVVPVALASRGDAAPSGPLRFYLVTLR